MASSYVVTGRVKHIVSVTARRFRLKKRRSQVAAAAGILFPAPEEQVSVSSSSIVQFDVTLTLSAL